MQYNKIKVAFLDRDGVINKEVNYLHKIEDFEYTSRCITGLKKIRDLGYKIIIITNQSGIARDYYSEKEYQLLTDWYRNDLKEKGIDILDIFHCPHHPDGIVPELSKECYCRKPSPGMIEQARKKYSIDIKSSILVGDKNSDIHAGEHAGIPRCFLVKTGHPTPEPTENAILSNNLLTISKLIE
ncbi:HAD family hydrolase [Xenorhabdus bovienii]|uniref:D,D-heptose 1,7-bisphosphate phosphatase n=1 Tax=Xenorhabdus bovienii TaxID=40576 RepID=A0AAJ1JAZ8_XENBV|nr:HAD family hydrolase [Xenorhabdus bovienii]MDE1474595.1 HAD family hydrolase [Xenorhabdus bovienii]MDE1478533.1 HAD family hydrolase [Xenorhabdus bovienii]MDE9510251.1 HAD family hydrolase [Xenorhabdus bovienii]MDE9521892.1 HAD family hydrolase [Xenorhabdus bovienii]